MSFTAWNSCLKKHLSAKHGDSEMEKIFKPKDPNELSQSCHLCDYRTKEKQNLKNHIRRMHGRDELHKIFKPKSRQEWNCHLCEFKADKRTEVKAHVEAEHGEIELKVFLKKDLNEWKEKYQEENPKGCDSNVCPFCGEYFARLEQHINYIHTSEKPWKCEQCAFAHSTKTGLKAHVRSCHNQESNNHICHLCGYKTYANSVLKVHIESKHEKKKRFFCTHCDAAFYYKRKLEEHIPRVHTGEDTFKCKECTNIGFKSYEHLRLHNLKVHKGVKFICDICGKEFSTPAVKSKHMSVVHHIKPKSSSKIENRLLI